MVTTLFEPHQYIKQLESAGVPAPQAEAHAAALANIMNNELVRRPDMKADFSELRAEMNTRFAETRGRLDLLKWMNGFTLAAVVGVLFELLS